MSAVSSRFRTAVTLCTVTKASAGPFVFHDSLEEGFAKAAAHGFDAVELFLRGPDAVPVETIQELQARHGLAVAAVGSGAGMVEHGLSLTDCDEMTRQAARSFIGGMIEFGGRLGAPVILGSMQGKWGGEVSREQALDWLTEALQIAGAAASNHGVPFLYEPLNRYETNLLNRQGAAADFLRERGIGNVLLLADLFHMNIEEPDLAAALREAGPAIGHIHWADSHRQSIGTGHTDPAPIIAALRDISYGGYLSAEIFPLPDADTAAARTIASFNAFSS